MTAAKKMYLWGEDLENSWFRIYDAIVVNSEFQKQMLLESRKVSARKIYVIPYHIEVPDLDLTHKENIIVFPHRLDLEKQPNLFDTLKNICTTPGWQWIRTKDIKGLTKNMYYEMLAKAKISVSLALQETFGIAMVESVLLGCVPLVPNRLVYPEIYDPKFVYNDIPSLQSKINTLVTSDFTKFSFLRSTFTAQYALNHFFTSIFNLLDNI